MLCLPKSSVFRILKTLQYYNYLEKKNNLYSLGGNILNLIITERKNQNLLNIASPFMEKLTNETNETTKLGILKNNKVIIINRVISDNLYNISTEVGNEFPIHAGAASKLLLAHLPKIIINKILSQPLKKFTENTITDKNELKKLLTEILDKGVSVDNEEYIKGIKAIACPIFNYNKEVIAALSIPYLATVENENKFDNLLYSLSLYANYISNALGYKEK